MKSLRAIPARLLAAVLITSLVVACAHGGAPQSTNQRAVQALRDANTIYEQTLIEAGHAHATGAITDAQLEQVRKVGHEAESALRSAQLALGIYLTAKSPDSTDLDTTIAQLTATVQSLVNLWEQIHGQHQP